MIYRIFSSSREYFLTGTPGLPLNNLHRTFAEGLSQEPKERQAQLLEVLDCYSPDEQPGDDLEVQAFLALACDKFDLRSREMTEVTFTHGNVKKSGAKK